MHHIKRKLCLATVSLFIFLTGCGGGTNSDIYSSVQGQLALQELANSKSSTSTSGSGANILYNICLSAKQYAPFVIVGSFLAGFILFYLFRRDKGIKRWCLYVLMIGIPTIAYLGTYFVCFLYGCFNF